MEERLQHRPLLFKENVLPTKQEVPGVFLSSSCLRPLCTDINSSLEMRSWASMGVKGLKAAYSSAKRLTAQHLYIEEVLIRFLSFSVFLSFGLSL